MDQFYLDAIDDAARRSGLPPSLLRAFVNIESGGNPRALTGSYKGLLQLSDQEFARHGGSGNIFDPAANLTAGAAKLKAESDDFVRRHGRQPTASELYLVHQQGVGGSDAHWKNPDLPAWQNMASTAEGRRRGEGWAKQAIWGNVPDDVKRRYGSVDNITSRQFVDLWNEKVARLGGGATGAASAASPAQPTNLLAAASGQTTQKPAQSNVLDFIRASQTKPFQLEDNTGAAQRVVENYLKMSTRV